MYKTLCKYACRLYSIMFVEMSSCFQWRSVNAAEEHVSCTVPR